MNVKLVTYIIPGSEAHSAAGTRGKTSVFKDFKAHAISLLTFVRTISFHYQTGFRDSAQLPFDMEDVTSWVDVDLYMCCVKKT